MKKSLSMLAAASFLLSGFALADAPQASLTPVRNHHKAQRHKAHKAPKHKAPKRNHNTV